MRRRILADVTARLTNDGERPPLVIDLLRFIGVRPSTMAEAAGVSESLISHWANGTRQCPAQSMAKLRRLLNRAQALGLASLLHDWSSRNTRRNTIFNARLRFVGDLLDALDEEGELLPGERDRR